MPGNITNDIWGGGGGVVAGWRYMKTNFTFYKILNNNKNDPNFTRILRTIIMTQSHTSVLHS